MLLHISNGPNWCKLNCDFLWAQPLLTCYIHYIVNIDDNRDTTNFAISLTPTFFGNARIMDSPIPLLPS